MLLLSALSIGAIGKIVDVMCQALFGVYLSQLNYHNGTVKKWHLIFTNKEIKAAWVA